MLKNVVLPLGLILFTSFLTVYFWYDPAPLSYFALVGFLTLGIGSLYIAYFIAFKVFPDPRNRHLPPLNNLFSKYTIAQNNGTYFTKGTLLGTVLSIAFTVSGLLAWYYFSDQYKQYHLTAFGKNTHAVITDYGFEKGIGTFREFEFRDENGQTYTDRFTNEEMEPGDQIEIRYSTKRPVIHEVVWPGEEE